MKLYPFSVPDGWHPYHWIVLGLGLTPEQERRVVSHIVDDLGMRPVEAWSEKTYSWVVGLEGDYPDRERLDVGDKVDIIVADQGAVRLMGGAPPPGLRLEKWSGRLRGVVTKPGLYSVTVTIGPAVKYDPLGGPGGPGDPGVWVPVDQPRQVQPSAPMPPRLEDLTPRELDELIVRAREEQTAKLVKEADRGDQA